MNQACPREDGSPLRGLYIYVCDRPFNYPLPNLSAAKLIRCQTYPLPIHCPLNYPLLNISAAKYIAGGIKIGNEGSVYYERRFIGQQWLFGNLTVQFLERQHFLIVAAVLPTVLDSLLRRACIVRSPHPDYI